MPQEEDNPALGRVEVRSGDGAAFVAYRRAGERIALLPAEVPEALSGQGVGSKLVRGVPDALRAEGSKVVPRCEFVAAYAGRHPEYRGLLAEEGRGGASVRIGTGFRDSVPVSSRAGPVAGVGQPGEHGAADGPGFLRRAVEAA